MPALPCSQKFQINLDNSGQLFILHSDSFNQRLCIMKQRIQALLPRLYKIFFWGLLVQFFLHTLITHQIGREGGIRTLIRLWKEIFILLFAGLIGYWIFFCEGKEERKLTWNHLHTSELFRFLIWFLIACAISFLLAVGIQKVGLGTYILSFKYDLMGFLIFLLGVGLTRYLPQPRLKITKRYTKLLQLVVIGGLFWRALSYFMPNALDHLGYNRFNYEGTIGARPPAVYYTNINQGFVRNEFLFERPIYFGFFLVVFRPLFALSYLRTRSKKEALLRMIGYGLLVFSTFSRAAIGVRLLETAIIILALYRAYAKRLIFGIGLPLALVGGALFWHYRGIFAREHSNTGHAALLVEGLKIWQESPFFWRGAGYSGPASHQICFNALASSDPNSQNPRCEHIKKVNARYEIPTFWYNPENQYVQIFMEYGILGLLPRLFCFIWLIRIGLRTIKPLALECKKGKKADQKKINQLVCLAGFGIGMLGLALEGMVLHSFVDRMVVYPLMLLYGIVYGQSTAPTQTKQPPKPY